MRPPQFRIATLTVALTLLAAPLVAKVTFAPLFQNDAVLQRETPLPIWGTADPGEVVRIQILGRVGSAVANDQGNWRLTLPPLPATSIPMTLDYSDSTGEHQLTNILVGDVWLCGGQSNMEWPLRNVNDAEAEIAAANYRFIRHIKITPNIARDPITTASGSWVTCTPETSPHFTAIGYFFARDVFAETKIPIGLINSNWGGTSAEAWLPPSAYDDLSLRVAATSHQAVTVRSIADRISDYQTKLQVWNAAPGNSKKPAPPWTPGAENHALVLNNAMIAPLAPFALRGVIWYQGEANADQPETYREIFTGIISSWRAQFEQPELPFYWVQLANWSPGGNANGTEWAFLREAQTQTLSLSHTGQALAIDIGDSADIHPRNKQDVGNRLARLALARLHGHDIADTGPTFAFATIEDAIIRVGFDHDEGLHTADGAAPLGFELAGADGIFHPATATIDSGNIAIASPSVPSPQFVRYAWRNDPPVNLINTAGLPTVPFRTDQF
jgi:sialate O-acetylesterase